MISLLRGDYAGIYTWHQPNGQQSPNNNNKSENNSSYLFSIILFLWILGTIVVATILWINGLYGLCVATSGQAILIIGLIMFSNISDSLAKTIPISLILTGGGMVLGGILAQIGFKKQVMQILPTVIGIVFLGIGVHIIVSPIISDKKRRKIYTEKVDAFVFKINSKVSNSRKNGRMTLYSPVYQYEYNGATYTYNSGTYSSPCFKRVGDKLQIYIPVKS